MDNAITQINGTMIFLPRTTQTRIFERKTRSFPITHISMPLCLRARSS